MKNDEKKLIEDAVKDFMRVAYAHEMETVERVATHAIKLGYRKERDTEWILDDDFESTAKVRYRCRECGYWQTAKKQNAQNMLRALRYCSNCGARAHKQGECQQNTKKRKYV